MLNFPRWKIILIVGACLLGMLFALPNLLSEKQAESLPSWLPKNQINLGLDLQGGQHLLLEVGVSSVLEERLKDLRGQVASTLRDANVRRFSRPKVEGDAVVITITSVVDVPPAEQALVAELSTDIDTGLGFAEPNLEAVVSGRTIELRYTESALNQLREQVVNQALEVIRRRIDEFGTREPNIQRQGLDRILVQIPGGGLDVDSFKPARLTFHLVDTGVSQADLMRGRVPAGVEILYEQGDIEGAPGIPWAVKSRVEVDGVDLTDAQAGFDQNNRPAVNFNLNTRGGKAFADITRKNVGRPFAIVLDNEVISAPVIQSPILGGSGQITGNFTLQSANELSILLRAGALPAPLKIIEERTVGPDLGADSIAAGQNAALIGLAAVIIFMILTYGGFGVAANVSLMVNLMMLAGALSLLQATLTLPGIAGIVLTIGMAVDANVLVFERIREEVRAGKGPMAAIESGYSKAMSTILDANVTTLIAAVILFFSGTGPVRGFAVTLSIGILTSVFTAVIVTRMMLAIWLRTRRPAAINI